MALIGIIVGGFGVLCNMLSWLKPMACFGWVFGAAGVIISLLALKQLKLNLPVSPLLPEWSNNKGLAMAALIVSCVATGFGFVLFITCGICDCGSACLGASYLNYLY